MYMFYNLP